MAYRYGMSNRQRYRRRRYVRKNRTTRSTAYRALRVAKQANKKELKWRQGPTFANEVIDSNGTIQTATMLIPAGTSNNERVGNVVYPTSIKIRADVVLNDLLSSSLLRIIVFQWKSGVPTNMITEILDSASIDAFKSDSNRYKSNFLYDKVHVVSTGTSTSKYIKLRLKPKKKLISYEDGTSNPETNGLYVAAISNALVNGPTLDMVTRMYYTDA